MEKQPQVSELETHLGYWLRYVSNHVSHAFMQRLATHGVTVAEWAVLRRLLEYERLSPSQLADQMGLTRGAISKLVDRLHGKTLVERLTSKDDQRYQTVELTAAGRRLVPELARLADENDHEFFGHLPPQEAASLMKLLQNIVSSNGWKDVPVE
ncbi:MarR family winged helix-turn-helix transcriptional regulator [Schlesneria sp.]|uniref:MarR family winged helix-turn-helix transcriptional regulator n=1 Tax=Schlesneria sp. TaxID=2762018 RepID=UPI002EEB2A88